MDLPYLLFLFALLALTLVFLRVCDRLSPRK
ncbi:MAG: hypothetical protein RSP_08690 [Rhodanobacter sp.]